MGSTRITVKCDSPEMAEKVLYAIEESIKETYDEEFDVDSNFDVGKYGERTVKVSEKVKEDG